MRRRLRQLRGTLYCCLLLGLGAQCRPQIALARPQAETTEDDSPKRMSKARVRVKVVELAGQRAYVRPGASAHVVRGTEIRLARRRFTVVAATQDYAMLETRAAPLQVGQRGVALVQRELQANETTLPEPTPQADFANLWPQATPPADSQAPERYIPLGPAASQASRTRLRLAAGGAARFPLSGPAQPIARGVLRAGLSSQPVAYAPWYIEADVSLQAWYAADLAQRSGSSGRPPLRVHTLHMRYGLKPGFVGALGRLRYAASGLGALDGAKAQVSILPTLTLGAFGGLVPKPLDGSPDTDTSRFGAEIAYDSPDSALAPRVTVTGHGSRFAGQLDERRLRVEAAIYPQSGFAGAYALASFFDAQNPWNAPGTELTAAGAYGGLRIDALELSGRVDMQRPERSLWLASFLPETWLCIGRPAATSSTADVCYGDEVRYLGQGTVGWHFTAGSLSVGSTVSHTAHAEADQASAFIQLRVLQAFLLRVIGVRQLDVTLSGSSGDVFQTAALSVAPSLLLGEAWDMQLRYRPALSRYFADVDYFVEHTFGAGLRWLPSPNVELSLDADAITGRDINLLFMQLMSAWRL